MSSQHRLQKPQLVIVAVFYENLSFICMANLFFILESVKRSLTLFFMETHHDILTPSNTVYSKDRVQRLMRRNLNDYRNLKSPVATINSFDIFDQVRFNFLNISSLYKRAYSTFIFYSISYVRKIILCLMIRFGKNILNERKFIPRKQ